jgi:hypothetical protein
VNSRTSTYLKRSALIIFASLLIIVGSFILWANSTNPIMPEAQVALESDEAVSVTQGNYIGFMPNETPLGGYILYPGGRVDARAYAPLARAIAEQGYYVAIVYAPLNLAFFGINAADAVIADHPEIDTWSVGGHSLGGVAAALYAESHPETIDGLVIMASFPANNALASNDNLQVVSIYGTNDGLASSQNILNSADELPANTQFVAIEGGNHEQFGYYGDQDGDGEPTITRAEQLNLIVETTLQLLERAGS